MALPYFMHPIIVPVMPIDEYYRSSATSMHVLQQVQHQRNICKEAFQSMMYIPPHRYGLPPEFISRYQAPMRNVHAPQPRYAYQGNLPFSYMPYMFYPGVPVPAHFPAAEQYLPAKVKGPNFQSQLKLAADRLAASETQARIIKQISDTTTEVDIINVTDDEKPLEERASPEIIVVTDDTEMSKSIATTEVSLEPGRTLNSVLEERSGVGYELALTRDPSLGQWYALNEEYRLGPGQEYISKIRTIVEGQPELRQNPTLPAAPLKTKRRSRVKSDKFSSSSICQKKRKINVITYPQPNWKVHRSYWYPRPVSSTCEYLFIGRNGTSVPTSFYATIPWSSIEESTRLLMEFIFNDSSLAYQNSERKNRLDPKIVQDIVEHISERCNCSEDDVRYIIDKLCADTAIKFQDPL